MELARITSKGQMTIPKKVREAAHLSTGDLVAVVVEDGKIMIRKVANGGDEYLRAVQATLGSGTARRTKRPGVGFEAFDEVAWVPDRRVASSGMREEKLTTPPPSRP